MNQYKDFREMENYRIACGTLLPDQKKVETLIQRKGTGKKMKHTKVAVFAAACIGIFACSIVGTAAAKHFQIQLFVDGKVIQTGAEMEKKEDSYVIRLEEEDGKERTMTLAEQLGIYVISHADTDTFGLVLEGKEIDITDDIRENGEYEMTWDRDGKTYLVKVTDGRPEPAVTVTEY